MGNQNSSKMNGQNNFNPNNPNFNPNYNPNYNPNTYNPNFNSYQNNLNQNYPQQQVQPQFTHQNYSHQSQNYSQQHQSNVYNEPINQINLSNGTFQNNQEEFNIPKLDNNLYTQSFTTDQNFNQYNQYIPNNQYDTYQNTNQNMNQYNQNTYQQQMQQMYGNYQNNQMTYQTSQNMYTQQQQQYKEEIQEEPKKVWVYRNIGSKPHYKYYMSSNVYHPNDYEQDGEYWQSFQGWDKYVPGTIPIHRYKYAPDPSRGYCYLTPSKHTNKNWVDDGLVCYLYKTQETGTKPIYRQANETPWREILNVTSTENGGWKNQDIIGYGFYNVVTTTTKTTPVIKKVPVYRYFTRSPNYHYLMTNTTSVPYGYHPESGNGLSFYGLGSYEYGTVAVHRYICTSNIGQGYCYIKPENFTNPKQWRDEGLVCYLYKTQKSGTIPIYRQANKNPWREILNTTNSEQGGWTNQELIGYGFPV